MVSAGVTAIDRKDGILFLVIYENTLVIGIAFHCYILAANETYYCHVNRDIVCLPFN